MFKSTKLWFSLAIRYLAGILIIFWLMKTQTLDFSRVLSLSAHFIIYGSCFVLIQLCLSAARIKILLNDQNVKATMVDCIQFNCVGIFYSTFLPGGISGDLARAYFFWKKYPHYSKTSMAGALFLDRFFGLAMMICIGLIAGTIMLSVDQTYKQFLIIGWISFFVGTFIFIISISNIKFDANANRNSYWDKFNYHIRNFISTINLRNYSKLTIFKTLFLSLSIHVAAILMIYLFSLHVLSGLSIIQVMAVSPLGLLLNALPLSPGGIGVGEKAFDILFALLKGTEGGNAFLITRIFMYSPSIIGGGIVVISFLKAHQFVKYLYKK